MSKDNIILVCGGADDYFKVHVYVEEEDNNEK